jgi:hypothetical protein
MAKTITFEGAPYTFPDDATDDEIAEALGSMAPAPSAAPVPQAEATALADPEQAVNAAPAAPSTLDNVGASIRGALGRGGSAVADALGYGGGPAVPPATYQQSSDLDAMMRGQPAAPATVGPVKTRPAEGGERRPGFMAGALGLADQAARGVAKGAVSMVGLPGDLEAAALNVVPGMARLRQAFGLDPVISKSVFGGQALRDALDTANDATYRALNANLPLAPDGKEAGPGYDLPVREGATLPERLVERVGEELGGMALPAGAAVAKAAKVGMEGARAIQNPIARHFVEQAAADPRRFVAKEALAGVTAGTGAGLANEATREMGYDEHSGAHAVSDLAGALGGLGVVGAAKYGVSKGRDIVGALTGSPGLISDVSKEAAASRLAEAADAPMVKIGNREVPDTSSIVAAIRRGREGEQIGDTVSGYKDTLADVTKDPGIARLEYSRRAGNSAPVNRRAEANEGAVNDAIDALAPEGNAGALRQGLSDWRSQLHAGASAEAQAAQTRFEEAAGRLQAQMHPDARGQDIRAALEDAKAAARDLERGAWDGVSNGSADIRPLVERFGTITDGLSEAERQVFIFGHHGQGHITGIPQRFLPADGRAGAAARGPAPSALDGLAPDERAMAERLFRDAPAPAAPAPAMSVADRIAQAADEVPKDPRAGLGKAVWDIRAKIPDVSDEDFANGLRELMRDKRGMVSSLSDTKSIKPTERGIDLGGGEQHLWVPGDEAGRGDFASWPNGRPQAPAPAPEAPEAATAAPATPAAPEAPGPVNVPLSEATGVRSALTDAQREAASAGQVNKARVIGRYVDAIDSYFAEHHPDVEAYNAARDYSRQLNDRFTRPQTDVAQVLDRNQGMYRQADASVPGRFARPDSADQGGFEALMREAGTDPRARNAVADQLRAKAADLRRPEDVQAFVQEHSRVLDQFPGIRAQLETRARTQQSAGIARTRVETMERELGTENSRGTSAVGQYLHQGPENTSKAIQGVFNAAKPKEAARELLDFAGREPDAVNGMRKAIWDEAEKVGRRKGETTANAAGEQPWMTGRLRAFINKPQVRAVVEEAYKDDPEHLANIDKLLDVLKGANTGARGKVPNTSGTAQGVLENMKNAVSMESLQSTYGSYKRGQVGASYAITSIASRLARNAVKKAHQPAVNKMLDDALLDPKFAEALLRDNNPANRAYLRRTAKLQGISFGDRALDGLSDDDDDPVKGALRRVGQ